MTLLAEKFGRPMDLVDLSTALNHRVELGVAHRPRGISRRC